MRLRYVVCLGVLCCVSIYNRQHAIYIHMYSTNTKAYAILYQTSAHISIMLYFTMAVKKIGHECARARNRTQQTGVN